MNYPSELDKQMAIAKQGGVGQISGAGCSPMPPRDQTPFELSAERLFERLGQLQAEVDLLAERIAPVLRPELAAACKETGRAPTECQLVEILHQASERVEHAIDRLGSARARLCI